MPITPFHFGPGAALHAIAPRYVSFLSFCAANVLIDTESLYNLVNRKQPVHAFLHTYVGASFIVLATLALYFAVRPLARHPWMPNLLGWKQLTVISVAIGAALGAYSHVILDSLMHRDMQPLLPFSEQNVLLGFFSLDSLHWLCIGAGLFGVLVLGIRKVLGAGASEA